MLLKLTGALILSVTGFFAGCSMSKKLYTRRDFLKSFIVFLSALATNIRYNSSDIYTLTRLSAHSSGLEIMSLDDLEDGSPFEEQWEHRVAVACSKKQLSKVDRELMLEFGSQLGKTDTQGQLSHLELYKTVFAKQLSSAEEEISKKSKLYKTMGFFVGSVIALMMI